MRLVAGLVVFIGAAVFLTAPLAAQTQSARGGGLVLTEPDRYRSIPVVPTGAVGTLPRQHDLSGEFPPVGNQGAQGSCTAWAVGYALKGFQEKRERKFTSWTPQRLFSPAYIYNQGKSPGSGCATGMSIPVALDLLSREGVATLADFPYDPAACILPPSDLQKQNASINRIAAWFRVNVQDLNSVKAQVVGGFPVIIALRHDDAFKSWGSETWTGPTPRSRALYHALVVTGYSDTRGAFKVINSWGTGWGDKGFGWIAYDAFRANVMEAYVAQDLVMDAGATARSASGYIINRPHGPPVFGVQLGMSIEQAVASQTRDLYVFGGETNTKFVTYPRAIYGEERKARTRSLEQRYKGPISTDAYLDGADAYTLDAKRADAENYVEWIIVGYHTVTDAFPSLRRLFDETPGSGNARCVAFYRRVQEQFGETVDVIDHPSFGRRRATTLAPTGAVRAEFEAFVLDHTRFRTILPAGWRPPEGGLSVLDAPLEDGAYRIAEGTGSPAHVWAYNAVKGDDGSLVSVSAEFWAEAADWPSAGDRFQFRFKPRIAAYCSPAGMLVWDLSSVELYALKDPAAAAQTVGIR